MSSAGTNPPFQGVTLARVLRAHGIRGELACEIFTDFPERLLRFRQVWLANPRATSTEPSRFAVVRARLTGGRTPQLLLQLEGIFTRNDAERLRGAELQIPLAERLPLAAGQYYVSDLIGCAIVALDSGDELGVVRDVQLPGESLRGTPVLVVASPRGELLVPLAEHICTRIDLAARRIEVRLPEGLLDLNA